MAARDYAQPGIRAQIYNKDIRIIAEFAAELRSPTPLFSLAAALYQAALARDTGTTMHPLRPVDRSLR
jgi:3-hydroxyisobutyrate dehydrogenase-like beta-hydroxyacid dehydrogenase